MVDSRCHSLEDISSTITHHQSLTPLSRSESLHDEGPLRLTNFATINLQLTDSPTGSQGLLLLRYTRAVSTGSHLQENRAAVSPTPGSSERGRRFSREPPSGNTSRAALHSPLSPDRFIPKREFGHHSSTSYRINKHHYQLSPQERIIRRRVPGEDPFLPATRQSLTFSGQRPTTTRHPQRPYRPHLVADFSAFGGTVMNESLRRVSAGSIWGVGGASAVLGQHSVGASNYTRSISARGGASPAYVARFLPKISRHDDLNKHESRLALALDVDPATRLMGICTPRKEKSPSPASPDYERYSPFVWKDSAWKKVEKGCCKFGDDFVFCDVQFCRYYGVFGWTSYCGLSPHAATIYRVYTGTT